MATGIIRSRAAAWPISQALLKRIERHQTTLYSWILGLRVSPGETGQQFGARKIAAIRDLRCVHWSRTVARASVTWLAHLQRHPQSYPTRAFLEQGHDWVLEQRQEHSEGRSFENTRTGTRADRGNVYRWDLQGWCRECNPKGTTERDELYRQADRLLDFLGAETAPDRQRPRAQRRESD